MDNDFILSILENIENSSCPIQVNWNDKRVVEGLKNAIEQALKQHGKKIIEE